MAKGIRLRCSCGRVVNAVPDQICPKCKKLMDVPQGGMIYLYRPFSVKSLCTGFRIYLNDDFYGAIGAGEYVKIPVEFGKYVMKVNGDYSSFLSVFLEKSTKMEVDISESDSVAYVKTWSPALSVYKVKSEFMSDDEINEVLA